MTGLSQLNFGWLIFALMLIRVIFIKRRLLGYLFDSIVVLFGFNLIKPLFINNSFHFYQIIIFLLMAILIFVLSTIATSHLRLTLAAIKENVKILNYDFYKIILLHLATALYEEVLWRAIFLVVLVEISGNYFAIISNSLLFAYWHKGQFITWRHAAELSVFSILLASLFLLSHSLVLVVIVHMVRNILIEITNYESTE
ncbi:MAG: membrane protease YdiL (CAAX protease family) [Alteromonadaceae bacterium]|jgi:membrane protease YdiL (CAAX protease family)